MAHASQSPTSVCIHSAGSPVERNASPRRKASLLVALAALTLVVSASLTGCGSSGGSASAGSGLPAAGSGTFTATFSNAVGTNATTSAFTAATVMPATASGALTLVNFTGTSISGTTSRTFTLSLAESGPVQVGKTYTFASPSASTLTYTDTVLTTGHIWGATGGSAIVDSITGKNYKVRIVNATFTTDADNDSGATGSFTVNGSINATLP